MQTDESILSELRLIRGLLAAQLTRDLALDEASQQDKVLLLHNAGLSPRDIAGMIDSTPNSVSGALVQLRKAGKIKKRQ